MSKCLSDPQSHPELLDPSSGIVTCLLAPKSPVSPPCLEWLSGFLNVPMVKLIRKYDILT